MAKSKLVKGAVVGNLIELKKKKIPSPFECFDTIQQCKNEKSYLLADKKRFENVKKALYKCDPRGMWCPSDFDKIEKGIDEFIKALDYGIKGVDARSLELFTNAPPEEA